MSREPSLEELFLAHYGVGRPGGRLVGCGVEEDDDERRASRVVAVTTAKRAGRGGALWGVVFGAPIAATAYTYTSSFPTAASRARLALSVQGNAGLEAVFGPVRRIDTVAGYTAYKTTYSMVILGGDLGAADRDPVLRGEEDAGRWELFLSGRTTRGRAALQGAIGLGVGIVALWVPTAVLAVAGGAPAKVGIGVGASLFFATAAVAAAAMFMAVGMLVGQLAATRHDANLIGAGVLAASYLIRMVADSVPGLALAAVGEPARLDRGAPSAHRFGAVRVRADRRRWSRCWWSSRSRVAKAAGPGRERVRRPRCAQAANAPARGARPA